MKMLRVVLVVSNVLEAPNRGEARGNQQPASSFSLGERCDGRGINPRFVLQELRQRVIADTHLPHLDRLCQAKSATWVRALICLIRRAARSTDVARSRLPDIAKRTRHLRRVRV
ncbi:hypothetical protein LMTR13_17635 [Bradyrhizobium icense]|uniref:Uncharacterized protein n=1 Tax=Bradyrhizobium icense TaxID=1274631 RepID=A0A1B1UG28_9BRAD|nr:hypothetical protein LMTR13_17635 [Bradyrhizobium icense]